MYLTNLKHRKITDMIRNILFVIKEAAVVLLLLISIGILATFIETLNLYHAIIGLVILIISVLFS